MHQLLYPLCGSRQLTGTEDAMLIYHKGATITTCLPAKDRNLISPVCGCFFRTRLIDTTINVIKQYNTASLRINLRPHLNSI